MKPAWRIVLEALYEGLPVVLDRYKYVLMLDDDGNDRIVIEALNVSENKPHYIDPHIPLNAFLSQCKGLTEEQLISIAANTALNKINRSSP